MKGHRAKPPCWRRGPAAIAIAGLALSRAAAGEAGFEKSFHAVLGRSDAPASFRLGLTLTPALEIRTEDLHAAAEAAAEAAGAPDPSRKTHKFWIWAVSVATIAGSAYNSFGDTPSRPFHFNSEG